MSVDTESLYLNMSDASSILSKLAISSQFKVSLDLVRRSPTGNDLDLLEYLTNCGLFLDVKSTDEKYDFLCSDASLPQTNFDIVEEYGARQGMIEKMAARRVYTEFDLTFYVDNQYNILRLFEEWMNYINPIYNESNGRYDGRIVGQLNQYRERNSYARMRYPDEYKRVLSITKFERDLVQSPNAKSNKRFTNQPMLTYRFIDAFPITLNSVPLTYEGSTITQVSVTFSYLRHTVEKHGEVRLTL